VLDGKLVRPSDRRIVRDYYVACTLGLEGVLAEEVRALGAVSVHDKRGGVRARADDAFGMRACLWLRSATRVQEEVVRGRVHDEDQLYELVRHVEWERWIGCDDTLAVDATVKDSFLTHSQFASRLVKDAIVDRFRDLEGRRPDVDPVDPALPVKLHLWRNEATIYVDHAGASLHKRGYREVQVKSPLNEAIAAGLLLASDWDRRSPVVDPMCGSGTFLIEAAAIATDRAPGLLRSFAFERWAGLDRGAWLAHRDDARRRAAEGSKANAVMMAGCDAHPGAVAIARRSIADAQLTAHVDVVHSEVSRFEPKTAPRFVVTNPPYGDRIGEGEQLETSWRNLGDFLHRYPGLIAWVLSGNPELTRYLHLSASRKLPVHNGPIDCRFLRYEVDSPV
jgi:putative N6-adenine-specific DNA methylase